MKATTPSLILYVLSCLVFMLFSMMGNDATSIYAKTIIIPSIFFYYVVSSRFVVNWLVTAVLLFMYIGDMYILMGYYDSLWVAMYCFMASNCILLIILYTDLRKARFGGWRILPAICVVPCFAYLLYNIVSLHLAASEAHLLFFVQYGILMVLMSSAAVLIYIGRSSLANFNAMLMAVCFVVADVFYVLDHYYLALPVFKAITLFTQVLSYYFMVRYFILRKDKRKSSFVTDLKKHH